MSRIGKDARSSVPAGRRGDAAATGNVAVKGPQGTLQRDLPGDITVRREDSAARSSSGPTTSAATGRCTV